MAFLALQQLQRGGLTHIIHILFVGQAIETNAAHIRKTLFLHDLIDTVQHEVRHTVIGLHGLVNDLCQRRIVTNKEPRINADAVTTNTGTRLQDVYARMHIANLDDLIDIHIVVTADFCQFVCKGDVDRTEGILNNLSHLCSTDICHNNLALAERRIQSLHLLTNRLIISTNRAVIVQQLVNHVAGDDTLRSMDEIDILTNLETILFNHRANILVDGSRRNSGLDNHGSPLRADTHNVFNSLNNVAGINLLAELIIRCRNRHDVSIGDLIFGGKLDTGIQSILEQFIQSLFLESGFTCIQGSNQLLIIVSTNNLYAVRCHHQSSRQTNVTQTNYVNHYSFLRH